MYLLNTFHIPKNVGVYEWADGGWGVGGRIQ